MKGSNVDFSTSIYRKSKRESTANHQNDFQGSLIDFDITTSKKHKSSQSLQGNTLDFTLNQIGQWTTEEKKPLACMICKLPIKEKQKPHQCPMCKSIFHDDHIFEWLKVKGKCPVCLQSLRPGGTEEVKN